MTLAKKFEENRTDHHRNRYPPLLLGAGFQSGIFSSGNPWNSFLRQTGVLAPLCFLLLQTIQVVIPVVPGGVSCIIGVAIFGPLYGFFLNYAGMVTGSVFSFLLARALWAGLSFKVCTRKNLSEIHFPGRKRKEIRCIFPSGFDPSRYA